nr:MYB transcription factor 8 [Cladosporium cladosporioides]
MEQYFRTRASVDDNPDLARDRRANDARLKSRFEHIFAKYGKDFDGVGDEIDLETGRIIVNNGHIARMRHEVDPGQRTSAQVLRVLGGSRQGDSVNVTRGEETVIEDSAEEIQDDEELAVVGTSGYSGSDNEDEDESEELSKDWARAQDELSSDFYPTQDASPERIQTTSKLSLQKSATRHQVDADQAVGLSKRTSRSKSPGEPPMELPLLRESMKAMQALPGQRGAVDPDMIQALGQSIANQLAKFMTGDSKKPKRKSPSQRAAKDSRWEYPMLPGDRIERTPSPSLPESPSAALFVTSPNREASVWAPQQQRRRRKSKLRSQVPHSTGVNEDDAVDGNDRIDPLQSDPPSHMATTIGEEAEGILDIDCYNCGATNSRVWRTGPGGRLCDSCGTYYRRYGLLKAIEDPSFTPVPRPGQRRSSAHGRKLFTNQEADVFDIPSTDAPGSTAGYAANTARRVTGDGRNGRFTLEEEESIIRHHEIDQLSWDHIGYLLSLRSAHSVHSHYQKFLKAPGCEARRRLLPSKVRVQPVIEDDASEHALPSVAASKSTEDTHSHDVLGFIEREDELIVRLHEDEGMTWEQIAAYFPGRTSHALQAHYNESLAESESSSSNGHALEEHSGEQTIHDGSLKSMPIQRTHNATVAPQTIDDEFTASGSSNNLDARGIDARSSLPHPYAMILNMSDEKAAPFREMAQLFRDRTEQNLVGRYIHPESRLAKSGVNHIANTSGTFDSANPMLPGVGDGDRSWSITSDVDTYARMPPPPAPSRQAAASERHHHEGSAVSAGKNRTQHLHTPSVHARQVSVPPRPSEVGPSAWAITQPASKGPLPFQPARKGLVPIYPKLSSRGLHDPFISRTITPAGLTPPHAQKGYGMAGFARSDSISHPPSAKTTWSRHGVEMNSQYSALPETAGNAALQARELSESASQFTPEQDAFIKKAREKRKLAWAEIAAAMPGDVQHTASAITHRYYDYLLGKRSARKTSQSQDARASAEGGSPIGEVQSDQVSRRVQQGNSSIESTDMISVPSSVSAQDHENDVRVKEAYQQLSSHQRHPQKPLLRRAIKNSTRRTSDVANTGILPGYHVQGVHQSSLQPNPEASSHSSVVSRLHEHRPHSHPEVVISSGELGDHDDTFSMLSDARTAKSARSKAQRQPNHLTHISGHESMDVDLDQPQAQANAWEEASLDEYVSVGGHVDAHHSEERTNDLRGGFVHDSLANQNEVQEESSVPLHEARPSKEVSSGTKRKRRDGRPSRVSHVEVADSDSDISSQGEHVQARAQDTPPAKRGRGRPKKSGFFKVPVGYELVSEPEARALGSTEPISPKLRSGLIRTAIGNDVPSVTKNAPHVVFGTWAAPSTRAHESKNRPDGGHDSRDLTYQTWEEILVACFRSQPGVELRCKDIATWVRAHSSYYSNSDEPWTHHVYNEVYRNPAFQKAHPSSRWSGYILVESNLRPGTTGQAVGDGNRVQAEAGTHSTPVEQILDDTANKVHAEPELLPASAERADTNTCTPDESNVRPTSIKSSGQDVIMETSTHTSPVAETSRNDVSNRESVDNDALVNGLPALASSVSQPTSTSANVIEVIDISSDSPVKQEPASEDQISTSQTQHPAKRLFDADEQSPRVENMRQSGPAPARRASTLVTPARSSANSRRLDSHAQSTVPVNFEPRLGDVARASPATSIGTSGRRVIVATEVARDDGDEQDELS